jgi:hypothetical protein
VFSLLWKSAHENVTIVTTLKENKTSSALQIDATKTLTSCFVKAYELRSLKEMFRCWSSQVKTGPNPKAIDVGSHCPFHWNHGMCRIGAPDSGDQLQRDYKHPQFSGSMYL